jgi:branched-chain amino acid transport system permease protein
VGALLAVAVSVVIGLPVFRLRGHYFAIATIALGEIAAAVASSWDFIGGASGLTIPFVRDANGRPTDSWVWFQFNQNKLPYYFIAFALMVLLALLTIWLDRNKAGFYFRAIKNDQDAARSLGVNALHYKLLALILSAGFTALLGSFYAQYLLFIDPDTTLALSLSILISLIAILGGVNTIWGPILGAFIMIPLGQLTRSQFGGSGRAVDLLLYGALIVLISVFQPSGLMGLRFRLRRVPSPSAKESTVQERGHGPAT